MKAELFIARRLKLAHGDRAGSPSLNVATTGIVLAIVVMILSVVIVLGFKSEITHKIYALNPHLKVYSAALGLDQNYNSVSSDEVFRGINDDTAWTAAHVAGMSLTIEKPAILKTDNDFKAVEYRGVDSNFDWSYFQENLVKGRVPAIKKGSDENEIIVSQKIANLLQVDVGDRLFTYFIDNKVKVRRTKIVGIYNTNFENFDNAYILGNIALLQKVNGWSAFRGNYVGVNLKQTNQLDADTQHLYADLAQSAYVHDYSTLCLVSQIENENSSYFIWLRMLDMNVIIILALMLVVSSFTLIAALLMIVLERIKMVGMLKALGATNGMIRRIFIYLTAKLIIKSVMIGNLVGLGLAWLQMQFHIIKLNPEAYYMPYVPIELNVPALLVLNVGIIVISYITLIAPSHIISTIKPTSTMKFE